ncbi:MAG: invasion associated locus B family protein [Devosia sp.]|nr:invasion associated locus B family protein [Devosia sp.]
MRRLVAALLVWGPATALAAGPGLPGGASALSEAHGGWIVRCSVAEAGKDCAFSQAASNPQTGAALMAVELGAPVGNRAEGLLVTAFGLRLDAGVQLAIDGQQLGAALPFLTCVATGCLVPLAFDEVSLSALKVGTALEVTGIKVEDGQPVTVSLSLAGFTAAHNRTAELLR